MQRWILLTMAALCALVFINPVSSTQPNEEEPKEYWVTCELHGLPFEPATTEEEDVPRIVPVFTENGPIVAEYVVRYSDQWSLRHGARRGRTTERLEDFGYKFENILDYVCEADSKLHATPEPRLDLLADKRGHELVSAILSMLRGWFSLRAELDVYRLPERVQEATLDAAHAADAIRGATFLGRQSGEPGETLVVRDIDFKTFLTDYEVLSAAEDVTPKATHRRFPVGWEVAAGVMPMPSGAMLVHGHAGAATVEGSRTLNAGGFDIEAPGIACQYHPGAVVLQKGEGLVLGGEYLVLPRFSGDVGSRIIGGNYCVFPTVLLDVSNLVGSDWPGSVTADLGFGATPEFDELPLQFSGGPDAMLQAAEKFQKSEHLHGSYVNQIGPLVVVNGEVLLEPEEREADTEFENVMSRFEKGPDWTTFRVSLYSVEAGKIVADVDLREAARGAAPLAEFAMSALEGMRIDFDDLSAANYYAVGDSIWSIAPLVDPVIRGAVGGTKVRWVCKDDALDMTCMFAPRPVIKQEEVRDVVGAVVEFAEVPAANLRINTRLKVGEVATALAPYPGDNAKRLILLVERLK